MSSLSIFIKFGHLKKVVDIQGVDLVNFNGHDLKEFLKKDYKCEDFHLCSARGVDFNLSKTVNCGDEFCLFPKVLGGKGGFGSLLRAFGKQITKSTNKDACRDLTGRRIKTVKRDKRLQEFLDGQADRAKQKEIEKKERREKRKADLSKKHMFNDPKYDEQKNKIQQDLDDALGVALGDADNKTAGKRKIETTDTIVPVSADKPTTSAKSVSHTVGKFKDWIGVDMSDMSEDEDDDEEEEVKNKKMKK